MNSTRDESEFYAIRHLFLKLNYIDGMGLLTSLQLEVSTTMTAHFFAQNLLSKVHSNLTSLDCAKKLLYS